MNCNCNDSIFKNDDTGAFGNTFLRINRPNGIADDVVITKVEFRCGMLPVMVFENPEFPIDINLTASQTKQLAATNCCYLKCYDENNLGQTCEGTISFKAKAQVI